MKSKLTEVAIGFVVVILLGLCAGCASSMPLTPPEIHWYDAANMTGACYVYVNDRVYVGNDRVLVDQNCFGEDARLAGIRVEVDHIEMKALGGAK